MTTIDLTIHKDRRARAIQRAKERNIIIPTYAQMKDPSKIPAKVKEELKSIGLWDIHPRNLFRINWVFRDPQRSLKPKVSPPRVSKVPSLPPPRNRPQ